MKSSLTVTSQCVVLGSLAMSEGKVLNWVNRSHQERMADERCPPTKQSSASGGQKEAETSLGGALSPQVVLVTFFFNSGVFSSVSILPTGEINFFNRALFFKLQGRVLAGLFYNTDL